MLPGIGIMTNNIAVSGLLQPCQPFNFSRFLLYTFLPLIVLFYQEVKKLPDAKISGLLSQFRFPEIISILIACRLNFFLSWKALIDSASKVLRFNFYELLLMTTH